MSRDLTRRQTITTGAAALAASTLPAVASMDHADAELLDLCRRFHAAMDAADVAEAAHSKAAAEARTTAPPPPAILAHGIERGTYWRRDRVAAVYGSVHLPGGFDPGTSPAVWQAAMAVRDAARDHAVALFDDYERRQRENREAYDLDGIERAINDHTQDAGDLIDTIGATSATTAVGTAAKLRAVMRWGYSPDEDDPDMRDGSRKRGLLAVLADLDGMGGTHG